jgi:hypothetical protein
VTAILAAIVALGLVVGGLLWRLTFGAPTGRHSPGGRHRLPKKHPSFETTRLPLAELGAAPDREEVPA